MSDISPDLSCAMILNVLRALSPKLQLWEGFLLPATSEYTPDIIPKWREAWGSDENLERVANETLIADLLMNCADYREVTAEQIDEIARVYAILLEAEARRLLEPHEFKVEIYFSTEPIRPYEGPGGRLIVNPMDHDTQVTVYRVRQSDTGAGDA